MKTELFKVRLKNLSHAFSLRGDCTIDDTLQVRLGL